MKRFSACAAVCAALMIAPASQGALVAWYPLDGDALDASGNGHDGAVAGTVNFGQAGANGNTGTSAEFIGDATLGTGSTVSRIDVPYSAALNPTTSFTVTAWVQPDVGGGGVFRSPITSRRSNATFGGGYQIYLDNNGKWAFWTIEPDGPDANTNQDSDTSSKSPADAIADGSTWTHLAITYHDDGSTETKELWVNGVLVDTRATTVYAPNNANDLRIGSSPDTGNTHWFDGNIDDITIWDEALDGAAINNLKDNSVPEPASGALALLGGLCLISKRLWK